MDLEKVIDEKKHILNLIKDSDYGRILGLVGDEIIRSARSGGKVLLAGNGGSAADAQHMAGEMMGRFMLERRAIPAISLCVDPSVATCVSNDYGFESLFARQVDGLGKEGDVFIAISTSGNSKNIVEAINVAKNKGIIVVGLLGKSGGMIKDMCDYSLVVPSDSTPRIQEIHTFSIHMLCDYVEKGLFV